MLLGVPDFTPSHEGIDRLGVRCRVDPTVSVMRFGAPTERLCLADEVSIDKNSSFERTLSLYESQSATFAWYRAWRVGER